MTMQRIVASGLVLWIASSCALLEADDGFIAFQAYYPLQRSMLGYHVPEAFSKAVTNSREWTALWHEIGSHSAVEGEERGRTREVPVIDFENYTLLVVASGARPSGGYSVALQSVWESESHVEVTALELRPFAIQQADLACGQ
jgi:hypothetical protein